MSSKQFGQMRNIANIGDIIIVDGYGREEFQVESYTHELSYMHVEGEGTIVDESIIYDALSLSSFQFVMAFQEDISVLIRADKADRYIRTKSEIEATKVPKNSESIDDSRRREPTKEEQVDRLLTEISDYTDLIEMFGDAEGDYQAKIQTAKIRISELTEHDRRRAGLE